jgi:hypothetical protein
VIVLKHQDQYRYNQGPENPVTAQTTFGGLTADSWDRLAGKHFYSTSKWLDYCTADTGVPGDAVVSYDGDVPAWAIPIRELAGLPEWSRYRWNGHLKESGLPLLEPTGILAGPSEGFQTHFLAAEDCHSSAALTNLLAELRQFGDAGGVKRKACVAMYLTSDDLPALWSAGITAEPVLLDLDAWISIPDGGWDAWLDSFPSKRRVKLRSEDRNFRAAGYEIVHMRLSECYHQLGAASAGLLRKYGHETTLEAEIGGLRQVAESMSDDASVAVCYLGDGDPVGFCIYYRWQDTVFLRWAGFDYDRLVGAAEYFNLCYYTHVRLAPELGVRWIHAGATASAAKALRGAELRPLWLLDLTEDSRLAKSADEVREHNARLYAGFADDPRIAPALKRDEGWGTPR